MWDWLGRRRLTLSKTWLFSWPDASKDRCCACAVERGLHKNKDHVFRESEKESK